VPAGQALAHLVLLPGDENGALRVVPDGSELLGDRVLLDRHGDAAEGLRGYLGPLDARPVVAHHREALAPREAERREPEREGPHFGVVLSPRPCLPDPTVLLADGRAPAQVAGVLPQEARERHQLSHVPLRRANPWSHRGTP